jgi:hypothetical protein
MPFPPVLDPILESFWGAKMICIVTIPFEAELVKESQKLICCKFLWQERMKLIIGQTNLCDLVIKKTLHHLLRSLGLNPSNLEKV